MAHQLQPNSPSVFSFIRRISHARELPPLSVLQLDPASPLILSLVSCSSSRPKKIIDASDQVADLRDLTPPFDIDFWHAMCMVPAIKGGPDISNTSAQYTNIIQEVDNIVALYTNKSQPASIVLSGKRSCHINFDSSIAAPTISDNSSTVTNCSLFEPKIYDTNMFSPFDLP